MEAVLARHHLLSIVALILLAGLAWGWLFMGAGMGMAPLVSLAPPADSMADPVMAAMMPMDGSWSAGRYVLTLAMWWIMMVAMMLPSAAPMILLYARAAAHRAGAARPATESFLLGYLIIWGGFSLLAASLQWLLHRGGLLAAMEMASTSRWLSAGVLIAAGLYQVSPVKDACLRQCRNPAQFLSRTYRPGKGGALRMGVIHGAYCVGCCWLLMALLFVGGVMNLVWIALLTLLVALEKLLPWGRGIGLMAGLGCMGWGVALMLAPAG